MRINEQSPYGVAGLRMLLEEREQFTPCSRSKFASATPRRMLCSWSRPIRNRSVAGKTVTAFPGEVPNEVNVHGVGGVAHIEMHVDVDVELTGKRKNALDLTGMVRVVARGAAKNLGAPLQTFHEQLFRPRIVGQSFLGEHTDLDLDRPFVVVDERRYGLEPAHSDAGIKLDLRSHASRPMHNALLKGLRRPTANVFDGHALFE